MNYSKDLDAMSAFSQNMHKYGFIKLATKNNIKNISATYNKSQQQCLKSHNTSPTIHHLYILNIKN